MHFILFLISYALNPVIIMMVPDQSAERFLSVYAIGSIVFSLYFTFIFSQQKVIRFSRSLILLVIFVITLASIITGDVIMLWVIYPFALLAGDYVCTQSGSSKYTLIFRCVLIFSALPFIIFSDMFSEMIFLRVAICLLFMLYILIKVKDFMLLTIESTVKWVSITYVFYSGSLLLVPLSGGDGEHIKIWFVTMQIGLGLILKKLDFSVRAVKDKTKLLLLLVDVGALGLPFLVMIFYPDWILFSVYMVSYLALKQLDPKEKKYSGVET
jgi:hypothetical protein